MTSPVVLTLHGAAESLGPVSMRTAGPSARASAAAAVGQSLRRCIPNKSPGAAAGPGTPPCDHLSRCMPGGAIAGHQVLLSIMPHCFPTWLWPIVAYHPG